MVPGTDSLLDQATDAYRPLGKFAWHFARSKLSRDPVFFYLLRSGLFPDGARVLDLGCGQGLLLSLLHHARSSFESGRWPVGWSPAPRDLDLHGIELHAREVRWAQRALGDAARIVCADLRDATLPVSDVVVLLDVLHYLDFPQQERLLAKVMDCLAHGGLLLVRVGDAARRLGAFATIVADRFGAAVRGHFWPSFHLRRLNEWCDLFERLGLEVKLHPMSEGTPFVNVLLECRRPRV